MKLKDSDSDDSIDDEVLAALESEGSCDESNDLEMEEHSDSGSVLLCMLMKMNTLRTLSMLQDLGDLSGPRETQTIDVNIQILPVYCFLCISTLISPVIISC